MLAIVVAIGYGLWGWLTNQRWSTTGRRITMFATIAVDIQLLLGIVLYVSYMIDGRWSAYSASVKFAHPLMMILALGAIHMTNVRVKRADRGKFRVLAVGAIITLVLVVLGIAALGDASRIYTMSRV